MLSSSCSPTNSGIHRQLNIIRYTQWAAKSGHGCVRITTPCKTKDPSKSVQIICQFIMPTNQIWEVRSYCGSCPGTVSHCVLISNWGISSDMEDILELRNTNYVPVAPRNPGLWIRKLLCSVLCNCKTESLSLLQFWICQAHHKSRYRARLWFHEPWPVHLTVFKGLALQLSEGMSLDPRAERMWVHPVLWSCRRAMGTMGSVSPQLCSF